MKNILLFSAFLFVTKNVCAQHFKLDNGIIFSSFQNKKNLLILSEEKIASYSFLLGADYLQKDWFYLSSQVGYLKLGGKETNPSFPIEFRNISESRAYIHLNTTFRAYVKYSDLKIFGGIGPFINTLIGAKNFSSEVYKPFYNIKNLHTGGKAEIGVTQDVNRFRVGFLGTYMVNLSPVAESEYLLLNNNAFSVMVTVGYRIR